MSEDDDLLTVGQAATRLRTTPEMVRRMLRDGRLDGFRLGGTRAGWRIPVSSLRQSVLRWRRQRAS